MRHAPRALLAGGLGFAASILVACGGGSGLLSTDQAANLNNQLNQVSAALDSGQCGTATTGLASFGNAVDNLSGVNSVAAASLKQGAATVAKLLRCRTQTTTTTTTSSSTTTSTSTSAAVSTPQTTVTVNTPTAPTTSTPAPPSTTPGTSTSGGAGLGGGNGGGSGTSGGAGTGNGGNSGGGNGKGH